MKKFVLGILTTLCLWFWAIFADTILPDDVKIEVKSPVIQWEATNLTITMMKDWLKMSSYTWTIWMEILDENWNSTVLDNEYKLPNNWWYSFTASDLWSKEFQKWLEIKREGTFYIKISDLEDNEFWRQKIQVVKWTWEIWDKHIDVLSPTPGAVLISEKIEIIWNVPDLRNSDILVYIDEELASSTRSDSDWLINYALWWISVWQHALRLEAVDFQWNILWNSDKIYFTYTPQDITGLKDVVVTPEAWLVVTDTVTITVYTDEMVESVKMMLSDRQTDDSIILPKVANWEFSKKEFLLSTWDISITIQTSASDGSTAKLFENVKTIHVSDMPTISNVQVDTDPEQQTANITWDLENWSASSYTVTYWLGKEDDQSSSRENRTDKPSFLFTDVPYDADVFFIITPIITNFDWHRAASKTITFKITKPDDTNKCGNWVADEGETCATCPWDLGDICATLESNKCGNWVADEGETCATCPWDLWNICVVPNTDTHKCTIQNIKTRTEKIGDNYYLIWDKVENVSKYIVYSSTSPTWSDRIKVYETSDTSYEYPFDHTLEEDKFMYFRIIGICDDWEELQLTGATKVQVWPAENFFLLICLTLLIYFWIKLFRQTEE